MQEKLELPTLSPNDRARLMLNLPNLANRFVEFNGVSYPILHLGIGDLEQFRAACTPLEELYLEFVKSELPFTAFLEVYNDEIVEILIKAVPRTASIVLGLPEAAVIASGSPLSAFSAVLAQWLHNQEIGALQALFPPPPDDEPEKELAGDPSAMNPLSVVQKMASAYHWPEDAILKMTLPKIYLMGNDSAWSYATIKSDSTRTKKKPIIAGGKKQKNFDNMTAGDYKQYLNNVMRINAGGAEPLVPAGGI